MFRGSCVVGCVWELEGLIFISIEQTLFNKLKRMTRQTDSHLDLALITGPMTFFQMIYSPTIVW